MTAILSKTSKPLTKTEWEKRQKRTNTAIKQLTQQYALLDEQIYGKRKPDETLVSIQGVNLDTLWQDLTTACSQLGDHPLITMTAISADGETCHLHCPNVQQADWPALCNELQAYIKARSKKNFRAAILKIEIIKPTPDTRKKTPEQQDRHAFAVAIAGSAANFMAWCGGDILGAQFPTAYPQTRLRKVVNHIQSLPIGITDHALRTTVLTQLQKLWAAHRDLIDHWGALHGTTDTWNEENPDQDAKVQWNLPLWPNTPEGKIIEQWDCYAGSLIYINRSLGLKLLDLDKKGN